MSTATKLLHGIIHKLDGVETKILDIHAQKIQGEVHYNPGLARDDSGNTWISIRSCIHNPERYKGYNHPVHYQNFLHVGLLDEKTLKVSQLKEIKPEEEYPGFQWGIEDVRLFYRADGLHGIGVILPILEDGPKANQAEILIDHKKGTYKLVKDYGFPMGTNEKNWSPPEKPARLFDFIYSPTQIVLEGQVIGEPNPLVIHNGTPLLEYLDGYISIAHIVTQIKGKKTYVSLALRQSKQGHLTHISQLFHLDIGWRINLQERIEFVSGLLWVDGREGEELLLSLGVKDELCGIARLPVEKLAWEEYSDIAWYKWQYQGTPSTDEIPTPKS